MVHFANNLHQTFATFMYPLMYVNNKNIIVSTVYTTYYSSLLDLIWSQERNPSRGYLDPMICQKKTALTIIHPSTQIKINKL